MVGSQDGLQTLVLLFYQGIRHWGMTMITQQAWEQPQPPQGRSSGYSWDRRRNQYLGEIFTMQILDAKFYVM